MNGHEQIKHAGDVASASAAFISVLGWLPAVISLIASTLSIIWMLIRMYEYYKSKKVVSD